MPLHYRATIDLNYTGPLSNAFLRACLEQINRSQGESCYAVEQAISAYAPGIREALVISGCNA